MKKITIVLASLVLSGSVFAQGVVVKKAWTAAEEEVKSYNDKLTSNCGSVPKFAFDTKSFGTDLAQVNSAAWCKDVMSAIADLCSDADYKEAIKGIKSVNCKYDAALKTAAPEYGVKLEIKDGVVNFSLNKDAANTYSRAYEMLKAGL